MARGELGFVEQEVVDLRAKIKREFECFLLESKHPKVKAKARRARKHSIEIGKLMQWYRRISIK